MTRRLAWRLWLAVILVFAVVPLAWLFHREPSLDPGFVTTAGHVSEYAVLTVLAAWSWSRHGSGVRALAGGVLLAALYGPLMEVVQLPLPYRAFDVRDMAADWMGALIGALVFSAAGWLAVATRARRG